MALTKFQIPMPKRTTSMPTMFQLNFLNSSSYWPTRIVLSSRWLCSSPSTSALSFVEISCDFSRHFLGWTMPAGGKGRGAGGGGVLF